MIKVRQKLHFIRQDHGRQVVARGAPRVAVVPPGRTPRIARLMALAIYFDRLVREGKVTDQSELARLAHVSQPRMTQIMNLNLLAPDIQEAILLLPCVSCGRDPVHERMLRPIAAEVNWGRQRRMWAAVR